MKRELERIEIPDEHEARERAWPVVQAAFAEREPQPRRRSWKPVAALRRGGARRRRPAEPARPRGAGRDPGGRRRRAERARALLPARARAAARDRRLRRLGRRAGRLEAAARPVPRGVMVSVRPLRRRVSPERARRARRRTASTVVARAAGRPLPALGRHEHRHPDRVLLRRQAQGGRRRRQGRPAARRPGRRSARLHGASSARRAGLRAARRDGARRRRRHGRGARRNAPADAPRSI